MGRRDRAAPRRPRPPARGAEPGRRLGAPPVALLARPRGRAHQRRARGRHRRRGQATRRRAPLPRLARVPDRRRLPRPARARDPGRARGLAERGLRDRHAGRPAPRVGLRRRCPRSSSTRSSRLGLMRHATVIRAALFVAMGIWAAVSLAAIAPLDGPLPPERARGWLLAFAIPGIVLFAFAAAGYVHLYLRRPAPLAPRRRHRLRAARRGAGRDRLRPQLARELVGVAPAHARRVRARRLVRAPRVARSSASPTSTWTRPPAHSVPSASSSPISRASPSTPRARSPARCRRCSRRYWGVGVPAIADNGGEVGKLIGDAIMAVFNERGDQPDHAERAVRAGLAFQAATRRARPRASRLAAVPRRASTPARRTSASSARRDTASTRRSATWSTPPRAWRARPAWARS